MQTSRAQFDILCTTTAGRRSRAVTDRRSSTGCSRQNYGLSYICWSETEAQGQSLPEPP